MAELSELPYYRYCRITHIVLIKELYTEKEATVKTECGNTDCLKSRKGVREMKINNLIYAGDTTLPAENKENLKEVIEKVKEESGKFGLKLNIRKSKIITTDNIF
ncbi:hypothetical protein LAZ67_14001870 [Cordylochernes scorpioides]|uniref:Reverse transcriptase domain-containing protein n=1 Tax=Cordylochernes scorpioides TaxID=51811 RepID=A0ABY6L6F5_9ARAC|nr:hypothetical protein LAZ67_14001870 [Cordylochernes scorpioides]